MAARLAGPAQGAAAGGSASPTSVRELIVIPEIPDSIHLQHAIQQVSSTVVEVNGDSSGHSSPTTDAQHAYITVSMQGRWRHHPGQPNVKVELHSDQERKRLVRRQVAWETSTGMEVPRYRSYYPCEGGNGVNYHVQYVEPTEIYTQNHQPHMEPLRSYPMYGVTTVGNETSAEPAAADSSWAGGAAAEFTAYGVVVAADEAEAPASPATPGAAPPPRMPPATVQWLLDNYETAEGVSLPRSTLYAHYLRHCSSHRLDPVNAASFGKLIRSVFIGLRTRRLGTRGNSKYHYYGIRAKASAGHSPPRPDGVDKGDLADQPESREREPEVAGTALVTVSHRQFLGPAAAPEPPPLAVDDLPDDVPRAALDALVTHHREHGALFLEAVRVLEAGAVERARRVFWRRAGRAGGRLVARPDVAAWLRAADLRLYQRAVDLLLPDVLRPIPPQLTQAVRNFAKSLEAALAAGAAGAPPAAARAQAGAAAALAAALRRYTSLNHLAQAARAVLNNQLQIQQMQSDLNRVDFRVVREQAAWACSCGSSTTALRLEADFKATLGRGATLEQWAAWLERCVAGALAPHHGRADFTARARRLLLDWSFYSSLVIRELTLRSAASFGSFHLIRLLYDEYVSYLIERRVAQHLDTPPIAVMQRTQEDEEKLLEGNCNPEDEEEGQEWEWEDEEDDDDDLGAPDTKKKYLE